MSNVFVFSSVGTYWPGWYKDSTYVSWKLQYYDNACVKYRNDDTFEYSKHFRTVIKNIDYKFPNFIYFNKQFNILDKYKYFAILDDDLRFNQEYAINKTIHTMQKFDVSVCSLSNDAQGKKSSYDIMNSDTILNEIWITNFCEMGCMIISAEIVKDTIQYLESNNIIIKDFGFDLLITKLSKIKNKRIGIMKNLTFYNPKAQHRNSCKHLWESYRSSIPLMDNAHAICLKKYRIC